jgi:hypothetical protein
MFQMISPNVQIFSHMNEQYSEISFFYGEGMAITGRDPLGCIHRYPFRPRLGSPPSLSAYAEDLGLCPWMNA